MAICKDTFRWFNSSLCPLRSTLQCRATEAVAEPSSERNSFLWI